MFVVSTAVLGEEVDSFFDRDESDDFECDEELFSLDVEDDVAFDLTFKLGELEALEMSSLLLTSLN